MFVGYLPTIRPTPASQGKVTQSAPIAGPRPSTQCTPEDTARARSNPLPSSYFAFSADRLHGSGEKQSAILDNGLRCRLNCLP